jgi:hypothetical protein
MSESGDGHIPFRGEVHPKERGHRSPLHPDEKKRTRIVGLLAVLFCIVFIYAAITATKISDVVMSVIGIVCVVMLVWAVRDAKRIKTITPDEVEEHQKHRSNQKSKSK